MLLKTTDQNSLAAGLLDRFLSGLRNLWACTVTATLISPLFRTLIRPSSAQKAKRDDLIERELRLRRARDLGDAVEAKHGVLRAEDVGEARLGRRRLQRGIWPPEATHEARSDATLPWMHRRFGSCYHR